MIIYARYSKKVRKNYQGVLRCCKEVMLVGEGKGKTGRRHMTDVILIKAVVFFCYNHNGFKSYLQSTKK